MGIFMAKGFLIGLFMAIPIGPMGTMCFSRSIKHGFISGVIVGMGIAVTDGIYSTVAAFGMKSIFVFLKHNAIYFKMLAVPFLLYLGYKSLQVKITELKQKEDKKGHLSDFFLAVFLTILNPTTVASFLAGFSIIKIDFGVKWAPLMVVLGAIAGSLTWWIILSFIGSSLRNNISEQSLLKVNKFAGWFMIFSSLALFLDFFVK